MNYRPLVLVVVACISMVIAGCASTDNPTDYRLKNPTHDVDKTWERNVEYGELFIQTAPANATIETLNYQGDWVVVATTHDDGTARMVVEATGRGYRIRARKYGYLPREETVALSAGNKSRTLKFYLRPDSAVGVGE